MAAEIWHQQGRRVWGGDRDDDGHRDYELVTQVRTSDPDDGPATVFNTPGLPAVGSYWQFGNDIDVWAFCWPTTSVRPAKDEEPCVFWNVKQKFSTRPRWRCQDATVEDPLLEPPRVGGSFVKYMREAAFDRFGKMIVNSSKESYRGPEVEFDANRPSVWVEVNDSTSGLPIIAQMLADGGVVNDAPMWGVGKRCVKFSACTWERKTYGRCNFYYTRRMEFDIDFKTHDRDLLDHGTKVLLGRWSKSLPPYWEPFPFVDPDNPTHYMKMIDPPGNPMNTLLDGAGRPLTTGAAPVKVHVEKYDEANLFLLGLPATF